MTITKRIAWKPHKFTIAIDGFFADRERVIDGIICGEGFGIHTQERYIIVSHLASGKRMASFDTLGAAFRYVDMVAPIVFEVATWHNPKCELTEEMIIALKRLVDKV